MAKQVFILGAGFSKEISVEMPLLSELTEKVVPHLKLPDTFAAISENIEHILTFLSQDQPWLSPSHNLWNKSKFFDAVDLITDEISHGQIKAKLGGRPVSWLTKLIRHWHENRSSVISLNYDTLVERAAVRLLQPTNENFSSGHLYPEVLTRSIVRGGGAFGIGELSTFKLLKLHGSINWFYSGDQGAVGETVYYVPADVWGVRDGSEARHEMWVRDKVPYIIPPITEKASVFRHEALRAIWRRAANGINSAEDIYLIGYSLPPTDLGMLLFFKQGYRMTPPKAKIHIVNPSVEVYDRVTDELGTVYDKGEYYSTINQFVEDVVTP